MSADEARELRKQGINPGDVEWEAQGIAESIAWPRVRAAVTGLTPNGDPIEGDYKFTDEFPMAEGFEENVEFFELTYEDPALVSLGRRFHAIAPLLWLKAGARGIRIDEIDTERGWSLPDGAAYGVLFDITQWAGFVEAVQAREDAGRPLSHAFVVSDSVTGYQQVVSRLSSSLDTTRLYADYLRTFEINTTNDDEVALVPAEKGSPAGSRPAAQKSL
ncbi:hypothetical protein V5H98_11835 [Georgenia sp. M64]|uniref:hypothetical protein n=1 Tax=Georgenia sp. M64 TaxID=3120520 RepID=UPI0030DE92AC